MNIAEAQLLNNSLDDLTRTLHLNRASRQRSSEFDQRLGLEREGMAMRREDMAADRAFKEREVTARESQTRALDKYRDAMVQAKSDDDKFRIFTDMVKNGAVTKESLAAMSKAMSEKLGVQVELKLPEEVGSPQVWEDKDSGRRFGYRPGSKEMHDLTPNAGTVTEEADPLTGEISKRMTRRLTPKDVAGALGTGQGGGGAAKSTGDPLLDAQREGKSAPMRTELEDHLKNIRQGDNRYGLLQTGDRPERVRELQKALAELETPQGLVAPTGPANAPEAGGGRVTVISPDGKRGTIPKAQLEQALKEGYKVAP